MQDARRNVEQLLNMDDMSETQQGRDRCNYILGLIFFSKA